MDANYTPIRWIQEITPVMFGMLGVVAIIMDVRSVLLSAMRCFLLFLQCHPVLPVPLGR
jgi:hypothetical protein